MPHAPRQWTYGGVGCPGPTPHIAVCLAGNARSFLDPRVHQSIAHNLVDALSAKTTVFAYIKPDSDPKPGTERPQHRVPHESIERVLREHLSVPLIVSPLAANRTHDLAHTKANQECEWLRTVAGLGGALGDGASSTPGSGS